MEEVVSTLLGLIVVFVTLFFGIAARVRKKGGRLSMPMEASAFNRYVSGQAGAPETYKKPDYAPYHGTHAGEHHESEYSPNLGAHEGESHESAYTPNLGIPAGDGYRGASALTAFSGDAQESLPHMATGASLSPENMRAAVVMREILDRPRALRPRGAYGYRR